MCQKYTYLPSYHEPQISSGILIIKVTDGINSNFVKSWSPTSKFFSERATLLPLSAEATGNPGSPTLTSCLSSTQVSEQ